MCTRRLCASRVLRVATKASLAPTSFGYRLVGFVPYVRVYELGTSDSAMGEVFSGDPRAADLWGLRRAPDAGYTYNESGDMDSKPPLQGRMGRILWPAEIESLRQSIVIVRNAMSKNYTRHFGRAGGIWTPGRSPALGFLRISRRAHCRARAHRNRIGPRYWSIWRPMGTWQRVRRKVGPPIRPPTPTPGFSAVRETSASLLGPLRSLGVTPSDWPNRTGCLTYVWRVFP